MSAAGVSPRPPGRVAVIGLDMGDGDVIRCGACSGRLPHLRELITDGAWFDLQSPAEVLHTSAWPTFATGTLPGRHGVYYPYQPRPGHQQAQPIGPDQYGVSTLWRLLDEHDRPCIVYDVPETFPEPGFRGRSVFDWGTWARYGKRSAQPPSLLGELRSRFGRHPVRMEARELGLRVPDRGDLEQRLLRGVAHKQHSFEWLLQDGGWHLAVMVFGETHPGGHYFWPEGARDVQADEARFDSIFRLYEAIDGAIGSLVSALPDDAALLLLSGDGVRVNHCGWHLLPAVLEKLGYLRRQSRGHASSPASMLGRIRSMLSPGARRRAADHLPWWLRDRIGARIEAAGIDWPRTRAFTLPTDLEGCIRVNLAGREPHGAVPQSEYDDVCAALREDLRALSNPATGGRAVRDVWIRNQVFSGPMQEHLPDVIVSWNDDEPITALQSPNLPPVVGVSPDRRTGTHSRRGFLLAHRAGFAAGSRAEGRLVDVAPTILRLLGMDAARVMEGRSLAP